MVKYNLKNFIIMIAAFTILALLLSFAIYKLKGNPNNIEGFIAISSNAIWIVVTVFNIIFVKYAWKWKYFYPYLIQTPNLSGVWKGEMISNYKINGVKIDPIPFEIKIEQTFFYTQIKLNTNESESRSFAAYFDIDKKYGFSRIVYTYENEPKAEVKERSQVHKGTAILNFEEGFYVTKLDGKYYTNRKTEGDMVLERVESQK